MSYWTLDKWSDYGLRADAPARAYRKSRDRASVHLCLHPDAVLASEKIAWWMLSTDGQSGLHGQKKAGQVRDARTNQGRLQVGKYELVEQNVAVKSGDKTKQINTWTWQLRKARYLEWEALLVQQAKNRQTENLNQSLACLQAMPMFAGIRRQVIRLLGEANKMLVKVGCRPIQVPTLPIMRMLKLWDEGTGY